MKFVSNNDYGVGGLLHHSHSTNNYEHLLIQKNSQIIMKQAILLLTDNSCSDNIAEMAYEVNSSDPSCALYVLYHQKEQATSSLLQKVPADRVYAFSSDMLYESGYSPIGDGLVPGNVHIPVLRFFLEHSDFDYYWVIESDVRYFGRWSHFFENFQHDESDLLASYITRYDDDKGWIWWYSFSAADVDVNPLEMVRSFNPIYRLSNRALKTVHEKMSQGWSGHFEVLIPTILSLEGMALRDMGDNNVFGGKYKLYDKDTMSHLPLPVQALRQGMIYHPVKEKVSSAGLRRNCVISAVGVNSLHRNWINEGHDRSFDLHLIVYDNSFGQFCEEADFMSYKRGFKLKLVYDYLQSHPEYLEHYEYFFIPDDDILTSQDDIEQLFSMMEKYNLKIAQPSLKDSYYTHPSTLRRPLSILRYVNFVEMMMPCFSRQGLEKVIDTFNANESGWGVEYHWPQLVGSEHRDMAVIDAVSMVHTQPVKRGRTSNIVELRRYLQKNGLGMRHDEYGVLLLSDSIEAKEEYEYVTKCLQVLHAVLQKLLLRLKSGEIRKVGLDGQAGISVFLYESALATEEKTFKDMAVQLLDNVRVRIGHPFAAEKDESLKEELMLAASCVYKHDDVDHVALRHKMLLISKRQYDRYSTDLFRCKYTGWRILEEILS